jgi:hypothetical protein
MIPDAGAKRVVDEPLYKHKLVVQRLGLRLTIDG